jgi:transcription initiation factor IIE alpha subunit
LGKREPLFEVVLPIVIQIIQLLSQRSLTQKQIVSQVGLTDRAVRYILSNLLKEKIILQRASLLDARQSYYEVKNG